MATAHLPRVHIPRAHVPHLGQPRTGGARSRRVVGAVETVALAIGVEGAAVLLLLVLIGAYPAAVLAPVAGLALGAAGVSVARAHRLARDARRQRDRRLERAIERRGF